MIRRVPAVRRVAAGFAGAALVGAALVGVVVTAPAADAATPAGGRFTAVGPAGLGAVTVSAARARTFVVDGRGGVPRAGVSAVQLTLTASAATASGQVSAWAAGHARPATAALSYAMGRPAAATAIIPVSAAGHILLRASRGSVRVGVSVSGWFSRGVPTSTPGVFVATPPVRLNARVPAGRKVTIKIAGRAHVPAGAAAIAATVTAGGSRAGGLAVFQAGASRPARPALRFAARAATSQLAIVRLGGGRIALANTSAAPVTVHVDVAGWFSGGAVAASAGALQPLTPAAALPAATLRAGTTRTIDVAGRTGVPLRQVRAAVVTVNVTPQRAGSVAVWAAGHRRPNATAVSFAAGQAATATLLAPVSATGALAIRNQTGGPMRIAVTVAGYVPAGTLTPPAPTVARYVRDLTGADSTARLSAEGTADHRQTLSVLDFGAQWSGGVRLTATSTNVSYANVVSAVTAYATAYAKAGGRGTIVVATNNDGLSAGSWTSYPAAVRGRDWADKVVDAIKPPAGVGIEAGDDIEPGFLSTRVQAQTWETDYLAATTHDLVFLGSADGCPTTFGRRGATCNFGWTEREIYDLAHNGSRITALPQVFSVAQAAQWADIDATGGGRIAFAGSLTGHAADPRDSFTPAQGWVALSRALASVLTRPSVPRAVDFRIDN